jgi:hypothetical protein
MSNSTLTDVDFPALFRAADRASGEAQRDHTRMVAAGLWLLFASAIASSLTTIVTNEGKTSLALISAVLVGLSLLLTLYTRSHRYEQDWYDGRAVAESIKTQAWRYMTCSEPYGHLLDESEADGLFAVALTSVVKERQLLAARLGGQVATEPQITARMRAVRHLPVETRRDFYLTERIENQRNWYSVKAEANRITGQKWSNATIGSQALALLSAFGLIAWPAFPINLVSIFAALAASLIAWAQLKRNQDLANAYGLAAQELGVIATRARYVQSAEALSAYVVDSENAISREHTLWIARRDQLATQLT